MFALTAAVAFTLLTSVAGTAIEPRTDEVTAWTKAGCYTDNVQYRALQDEYVPSPVSMSIGFCLNFCANKGLAYAGLEYGSECFCGKSVKNNHSAAPTPSECNKPCTGDLTEVCGAGDRLSLFRDVPNTNPVVVGLTVTGWRHEGCFTDYASGRTLPYKAPKLFGAMTVEKCTTTCALEGYKYGGVEFGDECYCGSSIAVSSTFVANGQCNFICEGNYSEFCGGSNRLNIYRNTLYVPL